MSSQKSNQKSPSWFSEFKTSINILFQFVWLSLDLKPLVENKSNAGRYLDFGKSNDAASLSSSRISRGLAQLMATLSQIIGISVHHQRSSHNAIHALQRDKSILQIHGGHALLIGFHIAQIARVSIALVIRWGPVFTSIQIEMRSGGHATIGRIAKFVHVKAMSTGFQTRNLARDTHGAVSLKREQCQAE